jgi:hypothetical protein
MPLGLPAPCNGSVPFGGRVAVLFLFAVLAVAVGAASVEAGCGDYVHVGHMSDSAMPGSTPVVPSAPCDGPMCGGNPASIPLGLVPRWVDIRDGGRLDGWSYCDQAFVAIDGRFCYWMDHSCTPIRRPAVVERPPRLVG